MNPTNSQDIKPSRSRDLHKSHTLTKSRSAATLARSKPEDGSALKTMPEETKTLCQDGALILAFKEGSSMGLPIDARSGLEQTGGKGTPKQASGQKRKTEAAFGGPRVGFGIMGFSKKRVTVWCPSTGKRLSGNTAPYRANLDKYIANHPGWEEYPCTQNEKTIKKSLHESSLVETHSDYGLFCNHHPDRPEGTAEVSREDVYVNESGDGGWQSSWKVFKVQLKTPGYCPETWSRFILAKDYLGSLDSKGLPTDFPRTLILPESGEYANWRLCDTRSRWRQSGSGLRMYRAVLLDRDTKQKVYYDEGRADHISALVRRHSTPDGKWPRIMKGERGEKPNAKAAQSVAIRSVPPVNSQAQVGAKLEAELRSTRAELEQARRAASKIPGLEQRVAALEAQVAEAKSRGEIEWEPDSAQGEEAQTASEAAATSSLLDMLCSAAHQQPMEPAPNSNTAPWVQPVKEELPTLSSQPTASSTNGSAGSAKGMNPTAPQSIKTEHREKDDMMLEASAPTTYRV